MATELERLLGTDANYYAGDPDRDSATIDFDVERRKLLNWSLRTVSKFVFQRDSDVVFQPVLSQAEYPFHRPMGSRQVIDLGGATGGTYTLSFRYAGSTQTTGALNWNDTEGTVQTALVALSNIGSGEVSVEASPLGFNVEFSGTIVPPIGTMTITSSLTGTARTPAVRKEGFSKTMVTVTGMYLGGFQMRDQFGKPGVWRDSTFRRKYPGYRQEDDGSPRLVVSAGGKLRLFPAPDSTYLTTYAGQDYAEGQTVIDELATNGDDDDVFPEIDHSLHEGIPLLAMYRAADPVTDEDGAIRRVMSANSRWGAEAMEIRRRNINDHTDVANTFQRGTRIFT